MVSNIFFDLDGTLTDSKEGIENCYHYAFQRLNRVYPAEIKMNDLIGLPLRIAFRKLLRSDDEILIERAVVIFRERFSAVGLFENKVYPGIPEILSSLHQDCYRLYVVTSKMKIYADRIVDHFQLSPWFNGIFGAELEGRFDNKAELIEFILSDRNLAAEETAMIGDRKEDIEAGKINLIRTIGVTYGYGTKEEIIGSAPDYICASPSDIQKTIIRIR